MTQITVYHHLIANDESIEKPIVYPVAFFNDAEVNEVFAATNSNYDAWVASRDEGITIMLRSTSVGDLLKVTTNDGNLLTWFEVAPLGYDEVDPDNFIITMPVTAEASEIGRNVPEWRARMGAF